MNGIVYKQWYSPRNEPDTPKYNVQHLKYIATRPGTIQNPDCGFGLWGQMGRDAQAGNIDNLKCAMAQMRRISKEHTVNRTVISLDEDTAIKKGFKGREEWQALVTKHAEAIAKQNNIDLRDFRWCASYHHERGHPHAHMMFWDNSGKVREEHMSPERFEIAAEKIRAAFNGDIFKEELKILRAEMDAAKKELRILGRNHIDGFSELSFFNGNDVAGQNGDVNFYPRDLRPKDIEELDRRLGELVALLPKTGQLKYQYLDPNVKAAVDMVSKSVLEHTSLKAVRDSIINTVTEISKTYGNSEESIQRQVNRAANEMFKDVGNDVLKSIKALGWLDKQVDNIDLLGTAAHERMLKEVDKVLSGKLNEAEFLAAYNKLVDKLPMFMTPKHEVLTDDVLVKMLRELTLQCMNDPQLKLETKISQAFETKRAQESDGREESDRKTDDKPPAKEADEAKEDKKESEEFKAAYKYVSQKLYDMAVEAKGWDMQAQFLNVNNFLRAFCRMTSQNNGTNNTINQFFLLRELSKQARKERSLERKDSTNMWDVQF